MKHYSRKTLIAHRGASAYAPEHTRAAYRLALTHKADFVEQDFQLTRDGHLVCLHDRTLNRTTDAATVFPDRAQPSQESQGEPPGIFVHDLDWAECRRLDAGTWFGAEFAGQRIPSFDQAVEWVRGRAGLFPELKDPGIYRKLGFDLEATVVEALRRHDLDHPPERWKTPVILQTFDAECAKRLTQEHRVEVPVILLLDNQNAPRWASEEGLKEAGQFCQGIGPAKELVVLIPNLVERAHALGMSVTCYTFRAARTPPNFPDVTAEMELYLYRLDVDAVFTDNPDLFPKGHGRSASRPHQE